MSARLPTQIEQELLQLQGGLDVVTPPFKLKPGYCRLAQNFESDINGGYRRIAGYERADGRPKPSSAQYAILTATITGVPVVGQTLVGATSGATGRIIALPGGQFVLTKIVGNFVNPENLNVGGPTIAVSTSIQIVSGASTPQLHAQYKNLAADVYRADIQAIPGSGSVLGVWLYNDVVYGFRNNAGATAADMYKQTAGGWVKVAFEYEVAFTVGNGAANIIDGATLTQGGVTATIRRVVVRTGSLAGGTAQGILVISVTAGGNYVAGAATCGGGSTLNLSGVQTAITLLPGGRFEFVNANFGGQPNTKRVYGCDGQNRAFEFDGSYFVPIPTGMAQDQPKHIFAHKNQLFLSFRGSAQHSAPGTPFVWSVIVGAGEIATGDTITGFMSQPGSEAGGALVIFTRNRTHLLYGSGVANWNLVTYRDELGAYDYTIQDVGQTVYLDDRGVTDLATAQTFGNFNHAVLSYSILPRLAEYRPTAIASSISRDRSQYRLFFSNRYAFYFTMVGRRVIGIMPVLFPKVVKCICSLEMADGSEAIYFGSDDGFVYQMEKGTSFDGDAIEAFIELAWNFSSRPRIRKRYRRAAIELTGNGYCDFSFGYTLGYGSTDVPQPAAQTLTGDFSPSYWDTFTWDAFFWDGVSLMPSSTRMEGTAENVSLAFRSSSDYFEPFTFTGVVLDMTPRRRMH